MLVYTIGSEMSLFCFNYSDILLMIETKIVCEVARIKSRLFSLESELALGTASSVPKANKKEYAEHVISIVLDFQDKYGYDLSNVVSEFPRVKNILNL